MNSKKLYYLFMITLFFSFAFTDSSFASCSTCTTTYVVNSGSIDSLTNLPIPSTGNSYCLEINGTLVIDDSWNADNICIKLSYSGRIIIESGNHLCNLTNSIVKPLYNNMIQPFIVNSGSTLQVSYTTIEDALVGFKGQGDIWLYGVDIDGWGAQGVGITGSSSGNVTVTNSTFDNLFAGITVQGAYGDFRVENSTFSNIDLHGMSATGVNGTVTVYGNDFSNLETAMSFATNSSSNFISDNTTSSVVTGLYCHTLSDVYINDNSFSFTGKGVNVTNIENLNVDENTFSSSQSSPTGLSRVGLYVTSCSGRIKSNVFEGMDVGAYFREYNGFEDKFTSNEFTGIQTHGLYLDNGTRIGVQCHQNNKWLGSYYQQFGAFSPDNNVKYNSTFTVNMNQNYAMPPAHSPNGWFVHSQFPCPEVHLPGLPTFPQGIDNDDTSNRGFDGSEEVRIIPNPAINNLEISLPPFSGSAIIELRDLTGRVVNTTVVKDDLSTYQLDLFDTNSGIYIISVRSDTFKFAEKLVIAK